MLSLFDDYPIHQTPDPLTTPASSDRDVYERYWFNGYSDDLSVFFGVAVAYYPHLGMRDCAISVLADGEQTCFFASGRAGIEPTDLTIGPFTLHIVEPMRSCRVTIADNSTGWSADLRFDGRTGNVEEPRHYLSNGTRRGMDTTRFTQLGRWSGSLTTDTDTYSFDAETTLGTKDRSWGIRPLGGGDTRGAPNRPSSGIFFLWAPLHFGDVCRHFQLFADSFGRTLFSVGAELPTYASSADVPGVEDPDVRHMQHLAHDLTFVPETRMAATARLTYNSIDNAEETVIEIEPVARFQMKGIGYSHPEWRHGTWRGDNALGTERWISADLDRAAPENQHVQHVVRATVNGESGIGALEQLSLGPYKPYGLTGLLDPAPPPSM